MGGQPDLTDLARPATDPSHVAQAVDEVHQSRYLGTGRDETVVAPGSLDRLWFVVRASGKVPGVTADRHASTSEE